MRKVDRERLIKRKADEFMTCSSLPAAREVARIAT
jgi:hypothetical protein